MGTEPPFFQNPELAVFVIFWSKSAQYTWARISMQDLRADPCWGRYPRLLARARSLGC